MRNGLSISMLVACAAAGVLAAFTFANGGAALPFATTTTAPTTTTIGTTTAATTSSAQPLPEGVTVGGVPVGTLLPADAAKEIRRYFSSPLKLRLGLRVFTANPNILAAPRISKALARARGAKPFANLPLGMVVRAARVRAFAASLARKVEQPPVSSRLLLRNFKPYLTPEKPGLTLRQAETVKAVAKALRLNIREPMKLRTKRTPAELTRTSFGPVIVIHRGGNRLYLYAGMRLNRLFPVATGQSVYPTPLGSFAIVVKWRNPWWYPPNSPWAQGEKPIPPGPNNPLGTRWMGLSPCAQGEFGGY